MTTSPFDVGRVHDVARIDQARADATAHRRDDARVAELHLRKVDLRVVGLHGGLELPDQRLLGIELLLGRGLLRVEVGVALEVDARVAELREVARALRLGLLELCLEGARVELREELAFLHVLPFDEAHALELTVDARLHGHARQRCDGADSRAEDRDILHLHPHGGDGHRCRGPRRWSNFLRVAAPEPQRGENEQQHAAEREDAAPCGVRCGTRHGGDLQGVVPCNGAALEASGVPTDQPPPIAAISATLVVICRLRSCTAVRAFERESACAVTTAR